LIIPILGNLAKLAAGASLGFTLLCSSIAASDEFAALPLNEKHKHKKPAITTATLKPAS
jgi:hypothetical protein